MCNYGKIQWVLGLCGAYSKAQMKGCVSCLSLILACALSFCPKEVKHFLPPHLGCLSYGRISQRQLAEESSFRGAAEAVSRWGICEPTELWYPWCCLLSNMEMLMLRGLLPGETELFAHKMLQTSFFLRNAWMWLGFFSLDHAHWFPCSLWQQSWRKDRQLSRPSPLALSGSQVKKDFFNTVLILVTSTEHLSFPETEN